MQKILSINIISKKDKQEHKLLNPVLYPIIFYWNDLNNNNLIDEVFHNDAFLDYINSNILNTENYSFSYMYYNEYTVDEDEIQQHSIDIQNIYKMKDNNLYSLANDYIFDIMSNLYQIVYKKNYEIDNKPKIDIILDIYTILKEKYKERVSSETLEQYIHSQLQQKYILSSDNIEFVLNIYKELIN